MPRSEAHHRTPPTVPRPWRGSAVRHGHMPWRVRISLLQCLWLQDKVSLRICPRRVRRLKGLDLWRAALQGAARHAHWQAPELFVRLQAWAGKQQAAAGGQGGVGCGVCVGWGGGGVEGLWDPSSGRCGGKGRKEARAGRVCCAAVLRVRQHVWHAGIEALCPDTGLGRRLVREARCDGTSRALASCVCRPQSGAVRHMRSAAHASRPQSSHPSRSTARLARCLAYVQVSVCDQVAHCAVQPLQ